jgi:hypothetical protein
MSEVEIPKGPKMENLSEEDLIFYQILGLSLPAEQRVLVDWGRFSQFIKESSFTQTILYHQQ